MNIMKLFLLTFLAFILYSPYSAECFAQPSSGSLESDVKAAYILNIMKFVNWESRKMAADESIKIALTGTDPISDVLEKLTYNKINGHSLIVERIDIKSSKLNEYHLLFIGQSEKTRLLDILKQLKGASILTVSDIPDFVTHGGIIGFVIENGRVKIEINMNEAKRADIKFGAKLLEVSKLIK